MKRKILTNARIVNPGTDPAYIEKGYIVIGDDRIEAVEQGQPDGLESGEVVDLDGKTVLPGIINAHTHLYSALALGMPAPQKTPVNFVEILEEIWWKLDMALDENSTRASFEIGLLECLRAGVTTIFDHHSSPNFIPMSLELLAHTADQFGLNISTAFEISDRNGKDCFTVALAENLSAIDSFSTSPYIHPMVGIHAAFTLSDESLRNICSSLEKISDWGVHIHVAEDKADEDDARKRGYSSVVRRLDHFNLINERSLVIHGCHMTEGDLPILRDSGAVLVHNPTSNANNRVGLLASGTIRKLQAGLGTDGMQANMLREAKEGTLIRSSHSTGGTENVDYVALLFKNNPAIASRLFGRKIGHILPGYQADLAIYEYHPKTDISKENLAGHLLFGLENPSDVMTRGEFRIRNNELINIPEREIRAKARTQSANLWRKMNEIGNESQLQS